MVDILQRPEAATRAPAGRAGPRAVATALRGRIRPLIRFALAFELLRFLVLAPLAAGLLRLALERWGRCSVGNFEIVAFLLSPAGVLGLLAVATIAVTTLYVELAGLTLLLVDRRAAWWTVCGTLGRCAPRLLGLGLRQLVVLAALLAPFVAAIGLLLRGLWAGRDLNGLLVIRPPVFWIGAALGGVLAAGYLALAGWLLLRWLLALPIALCEPEAGAGEALRRSAARTRGRRVALLVALAVWLASVLLLASLILGAARWGADRLLDGAGVALTWVLPITAGVLVVHAALTAILSILAAASLAALVLVLYRELGGAAPLASAGTIDPPAGHDRRPARWRIAGVALVVSGGLGLVSYRLLAQVRLHDRMEITAHRAGAAGAPENTVAALRRAIADGADWAEIDVQRTVDGALVVIHDSDLERVGGVRQRVAESTLAQIQAVEIGARYGAEFRSERVPTLEAVLAAAGADIRLNIELKPNSPADVEPLVTAVLDAVQRAGLLERCRLCSQSYAGLQLARQRVPGLEVGFIAAGQLGDLTGLEVTFLMVAERLATRRLVEQARARALEVHAWTINDPDQLVPLLDRGVANLITDDPAAMRRRLAEVQRLSVPERLLLRARNALAD